MSEYETKEMKKEFATDAAELFSDNYKREREKLRWLPQKFEEPGYISPVIADIISDSPGIAVFRDGSLVGYMQGVPLSTFREKRSMFIPEWGHASIEEDKEKIYQEMYTKAASRWVRNGFFKHLISLFSHQEDIFDTFSWFGFGMTTVDAARGMDSIYPKNQEMVIKKADVDDAGTLCDLRIKMDRFTASSPIFLPYEEKPTVDHFKDDLNKEHTAAWLAFEEDDPIGYIHIGKASDIAYVLNDEKSINIKGAYILDDHRRRGIGTALLSKAVRWAKKEGYKRMTVDFEPENLLARNFWLKNFESVCYSMVRNVDEIIAWANAKRDLQDIW